MKKLYVFLSVFILCISLAACAGARRHSLLTPIENDRTAAVIDIVETERSKIDIQVTTAETTLPQYFEVVATGTTASETTKKPAVTTAPKEYFTVKFVDTDGYTAVSVQTVIDGGDAVPPIMPKTRGELIFRGWDKDYTNVKSGMVVKAIYQKEWLTVRFFDADATLLKVDTVRYGETAVPPEVKDKGEYMFDGWNILFNNVTENLDVFATYYVPPPRTSITLSTAFSMLDVANNTLGIPEAAYYRNSYTNVVTVGSTDYYDNIIYGNFCDTLTVDGYGFTSIEGVLALKGKADTESTYALRLYIYGDGKQIYHTELTKPGTYKNFKADISGVKELTVRLEPLVNDALYYGDVSFIGGLIDTNLYEN